MARQENPRTKWRADGWHSISKFSRSVVQPSLSFNVSAKNREVEVDHQMNEEVKVTHTLISCTSTENRPCPELFPVRVTFLSEAAKLVVQKCEEQQNDEKMTNVSYDG